MFPGMAECVAMCERGRVTVEQARPFANAMKDATQRAAWVYLGRMQAFVHEHAQANDKVLRGSIQTKTSSDRAELFGRQDWLRGTGDKLVLISNQIRRGEGVAPALAEWMKSVKDPTTDPLPALITSITSPPPIGAPTSPANVSLSQQRKELERQLAAQNAELATVRAEAAAKGIVLPTAAPPTSSDEGEEMSDARRDELLGHTSIGRATLEARRSGGGRTAPPFAAPPTPRTAAKNPAPVVDNDATPMSTARRRELLNMTALGHAILIDEDAKAGRTTPCVGSKFESEPLSEARRRELLGQSAVGRHVMASEKLAMSA